MGRRPRRPGLPGGARRPFARLRGTADAAVPRRAPLRARGPRDLAQARGPHAHRLAQAQQRARPGAARPPDGQAADHRRDRRGPARRRERDGLRAARPGVRRLHGRRGHPPPGAQRPAHAPARRRGVERRGRRPDAEGGRERGDPRLGLERRHDALHHRLGRRPGAVPGDRARPAARHRRRGPGRPARPRRPAARPRHRVRRRRLELDRDLHAVRRRRGASRSSASRPPARAWRAGATARR